MKAPLYVSDAAAAIIRVGEDGYLMQLRDARPDIWYPGCWGLFGGGLEPGEEPVEALRRELREELELEFDTADFFVRIDFDIGGANIPRFYRSCYIIAISPAAEEQLVVHEGAGKRVFSGSDLLLEPNVAPYDSFALFLYLQRERLKGSQ